MAAGPAIAIGLEAIGSGNRFLSNRDKREELERRGVDIPFHQSFLQSLLGPSVGGRITEGSLDRKLARTDPGLTNLGLPAAGAGLEEAARNQMDSIRANVGAQLSASLSRNRIDAAQRGVLRSGGTIRNQDALKEAAFRATASGVAGVGLQTEELRQRASQAQQAFNIQVAQLEAQKDQANNQMLSSIISSVAELAPSILGNLFGGGDGGDQLFDFDSTDIAFQANQMLPLPQLQTGQPLF